MSGGPAACLRGALESGVRAPCRTSKNYHEPSSLVMMCDQAMTFPWSLRHCGASASKVSEDCSASTVEGIGGLRVVVLQKLGKC